MSRWNDLLAVADHRPYPLPSSRWSMTMTWESLLFAHWPIPLGEMRSLVPSELELDSWEGEAWIGVVPFRSKGTTEHLMARSPA